MGGKGSTSNLTLSLPTRVFYGLKDASWYEAGDLVAK